MDSKEKIMDATYQILIQEGYSGLSTRKIAEEAGVDKAMIYHHYGSKKGLIQSFLDKIMEEVENEHRHIINSPKDEILEQLLDLSFSMEEEGRWEFEKALLEIHAQASKDEELSKKLEELDRKFLEILQDIFSRLGDREPETAAEIYLSLVHGSIARKAALQDQKGLKHLRSEIEEILMQRLN